MLKMDKIPWWGIVLGSVLKYWPHVLAAIVAGVGVLIALI